MNLTPTNNAIVLTKIPLIEETLAIDAGAKQWKKACERTISNKKPPLIPDSLPFGYQQLQEVIDLDHEAQSDKLTVLAAHDMRSRIWLIRRHVAAVS